jgi:hypothetical protein
MYLGDKHLKYDPIVEFVETKASTTKYVLGPIPEASGSKHKEEESRFKVLTSERREQEEELQLNARMK